MQLIPALNCTRLRPVQLQGEPDSKSHSITGEYVRQHQHEITGMTLASPMGAAIAAARMAQSIGEVPIGAVIVGPDRAIIAAASNRNRTDGDPTAHAEILAIREACRRTGQRYLDGHDLYVTLEPCAMCAAAISHARISRLYFGAHDAKSGAVESGPCLYAQATCHHRPEVYGGIHEDACATLLRDFFLSCRQDN